MPIQYTCKGADISPQLAWTAIPAGTKSFAIVCRDIDAPNGEFIHWIIYNISPVATRLLENQPKNEVADNSASQGQNDFGKIGWNGPCPPIGKPHKYVFTVYSLDQKLNLAKQPVIMKVLDEAMKDHVIAKASITCTFQTTKK
jgi:Raf kinase inhibitor-like YbhB/YbcL family protein